jgi:hypothetical protein
MQLLTREELRGLMEVGGGHHVSIYIATIQATAEIEQNRVRFKNNVSEAREQLVAAGTRLPEIEDLLWRAEELVEDNRFWQYQTGGLVAFIAPDFFRTFRLPYEFEALTVVGERFHVKPLMPLLSGDGRFYILALSQNRVRLFRGTRFSVGEVRLEETPESLAEALRYEEPEQRVQWHTGTDSGAGGGARPAAFHAHMQAADEEKNRILRFLQQVDRGVSNLLAGETVPLLLAGVEYLLPIYHEANTYPHLLGDGITGNPDEMSAEELHHKAWGVVAPHFQEARQKAVEVYLHLKGTDSERASDDLAEIVPAAYFERVGHLFVPVDVERWGAWDSESGRVEIHEERRTGDEDLLDLAAVQTLINGGVVYALGLDEIPGGGLIAAILRF